MSFPSTSIRVTRLPDPKKVANIITVTFIIVAIVLLLSGFDFRSIAQDMSSATPLATAATH
jgi:hypothetical protein